MSTFSDIYQTNNAVGQKLTELGYFATFVCNAETGRCQFTFTEKGEHFRRQFTEIQTAIFLDDYDGDIARQFALQRLLMEPPDTAESFFIPIYGKT